MRHVVIGLATIGLTIFFTVPGRAATDVSGSWEVSIDCGIYATATSFATISEDVGTGVLAVSTPPIECGTVEAPGGIYEVATCYTTPDPRNGAVTGTAFASPTAGYFTSDVRAADRFQFSFTDCAVARLVSEDQYVGTVETDTGGAASRITGTLFNGALTLYDGQGGICFSVPSTGVNCRFDMLRNDVAVSSGVRVMPLAGVTVTFDTVTTPGSVAVMPITTPSAAVPANFQVYTVSGGFGGPAVPLFYEIQTTAAVAGPITSCFTYPDANGDGIVDGTTPPLAATDLKILHAEDGAFVDRTLLLDTASHVVCARTPGLSEVVIGTGPAPAPRSSTTTTTLPCTSARCALDGARTGPECADQAIPPGVVAKLTKAATLIDQAATSPPKRARHLLRVSKRLLARAGLAATRAAARRYPRISVSCASALKAVTDRVAAGLGI